MYKFGLDLENEEHIRISIEENIVQRNEKLENLIRLLASVNVNYFITIDGKWGCGKSFLLKQLMYLSDNEDAVKYLATSRSEKYIEFFQKNHIIYYNAWENDNHVSATESILYCIIKKFQKNKNNIIDNGDAIKGLGLSILKNVIEKLSVGCIKKEELDSITTYEKLIEHIVTVEEKKKAINTFLKEIVSSNKERIVLVVDELDRCKPTFAVEVLETLKHFYNNEKLTVITATNIKALSETVKCHYGSEFDGYGYLEKFYDTILTLETENLDKYVPKYLDIYKETNLSENVSVELFKHLKFSYRQCNKYMSLYTIALNYINLEKGKLYDNKYLFESCIILPLILAYKLCDYDSYEKLILGKGEEIIKSFIAHLESINRPLSYIIWIKSSILKIDDNDDFTIEFIKKYKEIIEKENGNCEVFPLKEALGMLGNNSNYSKGRNE